MKKQYVVISALLFTLVIMLSAIVLVNGAAAGGDKTTWYVKGGGTQEDPHDKGRRKQSSADQGLSSVVKTRWLAEHLHSPAIRTVFVDNYPTDRTKYDSGHIPGSSFMTINELMDTIGDGSTPPDRAKYESMMKGLGINNSDHVILYGASGNRVFTLGAFWLMDYFRHDKTGYLNGGLSRWKNEKHDVKDVQKERAASDYYADNPDESIRADAAYVLSRLNSPDTVIVDVRAPEEYAGKKNEENNKRTGHIRGAINLNYYSTNFDDSTETIKSYQTLQDVYEKSGVTRDKEIIVYCQGGIRAANTYFVLRNVLNYPRVRNYIGSWGEWGNRIDFEKYPAEKQPEH